MKVSKGFIIGAFKVINKDNGKKYDCFIQDYEYLNGEHEARFNIGINGWNEWNFIMYIDEEKFNNEFEIL